MILLHLNVNAQKLESIIITDTKLVSFIEEIIIEAKNTNVIYANDSCIKWCIQTTNTKNVYTLHNMLPPTSLPAKYPDCQLNTNNTYITKLNGDICIFKSNSEFGKFRKTGEFENLEKYVFTLPFNPIYGLSNWLFCLDKEGNNYQLLKTHIIYDFESYNRLSQECSLPLPQE